MRNKKHRLLYWIVTLLFVLPQGWSAVQYLTEAPRMTDTITNLGYPVYFMKMLAAAKLLGIAAVVFGPPALKEWAYAGFTFDVLGAAVSHVLSGDPLHVAALPLAFLVVQLTSYFMWKRQQSRRRVRSRAFDPPLPRTATPAH